MIATVTLVLVTPAMDAWPAVKTLNHVWKEAPPSSPGADRSKVGSNTITTVETIVASENRGSRRT